MVETIVELLRRHAAERPGKTAFAAGADSVTFLELEERAGRFARGLAALGHRRGEPVLICLPAGLDAVVATLGTVRAAGVGVPVNPRASTAELAGLTAGAAPDVTVSAGATTVAQVLAAAGDVPARDDLGLDEDAWIHYTSGSTGVVGVRQRVASGWPGVPEVPEVPPVTPAAPEPSSSVVRSVSGRPVERGFVSAGVLSSGSMGRLPVRESSLVVMQGAYPSVGPGNRLPTVLRRGS